MAAPWSPPSLLEALSGDFLACKICLEQLRAPKTLPCLHTYCRECLARLAAGGRVRCPECREAAAVPAGGVGAFKTNFFVSGLLDLVRARAAGDAPSSEGAEGRLCAADASRARTDGLSTDGPSRGAPREQACAPRPALAALLAGADGELAALAARGEEERAALALLRERAADAGARAEAAAERLARALAAQKREALSRLSAHVEAAEAEARERLAALERRERVAREAAALARRVLALGPEAEVPALEDAVARRLRQLQDRPRSPARPPRLPRLELHPGVEDGSLLLLRLAFDEEDEEGEEGQKRGEDGAEDKEDKDEDGKDKEDNGASEDEDQDLDGAHSARGDTPSPAARPPTARDAHEDHEARVERGGRAARRRRARGRSRPAEAREPSPVPRPPPDGSGLPRPAFAWSFPTRMPGDRRAPRITGLCAHGPQEVLVADEQNRALKRFSLRGDYRGAVPVPDGCAPCSVAALRGAVAFSAGARLYLAGPDGAVRWRRALSLAQASHAVAALPCGERVAVSVAGHVEVYKADGSLATRFLPGGGARRGQRALVFLAAHPDGGFVASDWQRGSVLACDAQGQDLPWLCSVPGDCTAGSLDAFR
ncbi:E3 ubiquitin-protein ligase TRIM56 isoform X2 [Meriones unguiculatus]|uniref:E3 ubiquitin-protein ligase TRIM56 isoform X2 n=1 Tax=Meriones unguiculatus TaxID=10047 RepID=UPI00293E817C|nr:E3 ubiquitin-protein ligase TRIM56 isoform X2 [Meriones unguiculatus]